MIWHFRGRTLTFENVRTVGVLNLTPDSFSDGGEFNTPEKALERARALEKEGADLLDLGAESTRPGAAAITEAEEIARLIPALEVIRPQVKIPISVDTTKIRVARLALEKGADILNDVDGLHAAGAAGRQTSSLPAALQSRHNGAGSMSGLAREFGAGLILMHRRGTPETMQGLAQYENVVEEVFAELDQSLTAVLESGVSPEQIVVDPGIGFAKTAEQNLELLAGLERFQAWGRPVLVGPSRKSFIGALIGKPSRERDWGTAAAVALAVAYGAHLVRVHDVGAMRDVVRVAQPIVQAKGIKQSLLKTPSS